MDSIFSSFSDVIFESDVEEPATRSKWVKDVGWTIIGKVVCIREGHPDLVDQSQ
jgi:hypothetical protein